LDLLRRHLRLFLGLRIGLDSRSHPRIVGCRGDDLFMAVGSGSVFICHLPSFRRSSRVIDLHRRISRHHRDRNDLVVACREQQALRLDRRERVIPWVNSCPFKSSLIPISEQRPEGGRRVDIIEIVDQWYGPGYRYVKVRAYDDSVYILRFDEICHWELIMFCAAPAQGWQRNYHDLARSAQSRQ